MLRVLWPIPARSPDLNPIERFWGWLRAELRRRDLQDLQAKKAALSKSEYLTRARSVLKTKKAETVAGCMAKSMKKTCASVIKKKGGATRG